MSLYWKLAKISIKSQMQYRASFFLLLITHFLGTSIEIIGIWVLFDRFKMVQGWTLAEMALIYGIVHMAFSTAEATARGFDTFSLMIKQGDFDRVLLRPCATLIQIATREFQLMRLGRFIQGFLVLLWSFHALKLTLFSWHTLILLFSYVGATSLFYALIILQATLCFWTTESLEMMNILTFGGLEASQYPMTIYQPLFRYFFTFIVPFACVSYYPIAILLRHELLPVWMGGLFPLAGIAFFLVASRLWAFGVGHYHSTGS